MRHYLLFLFLTLTFSLHAQSIIVNPPAAPESALGAEALTVEVLIDGGECSAIENFELTDNPQAQYPSQNRSWGYFEKGTSNFPFEKGLVPPDGELLTTMSAVFGSVYRGSHSRCRLSF